jgi:hypothetical protein
LVKRFDLSIYLPNFLVANYTNMTLKVPHIESDKVSSGICVVSSIALLVGAILVLVELGEYAVSQIVSLF